jgi:transcription initiation factor IIE alpha subunit
VEVTYFKCPHCGEVYIAALLNDEIAEINKNIKQLLLLLTPVLQSINKYKIS